MKNIFNKLPKIAGGVILTLTILMMCYLTSCKPDPGPFDPVNVTSSKNLHCTPIKITEIVKMGKKLENPFKLENMQKAYNSLMSNSKYKTYGTNYPNISKTHRYIKFKPKTEDEANIMYNWDITHLLSTTPKDVEILSSGAAYRDPECKPGQPSYMYANVPIDVTLPESVEYEVLYDLYVPKIFVNANSTENRTENKNKKIKEYLSNTGNNNNILFDKLISEESFYITNNVKNTHNSDDFKDKLIDDTKNRKKTNSSSYLNDIFIINGKIVDNNSQPVVGIRVFAYYRFDFIPRSSDPEGIQLNEAYTNTDQEGKFFFKIHRNSEYKEILTHVYIAFHFSLGVNGRFRITNNNNEEVRLIGSERVFVDINDKTKNMHNVPDICFINDNYFNYLYTCHEAARHYYFGDIKGLRTPPTRAENTDEGTGITIKCFSDNGSDEGNFLATREKMNGGATIHIYKNGKDTAVRHYSVVIHELAHASHWAFSNTKFERVEKIVKESWAKGVELELTKMKFPGHESAKTEYSRGLYTGICEDLIDPVEIDTSCYIMGKDGKYCIMYYDFVEGYKINQLEDALLNTKTWEEWRDNIKNQGNNPTKHYVNNAFKLWNSDLEYTPDPVIFPFKPNVSPRPPQRPNPRTISIDPIQSPCNVNGAFFYPESGTNRRIRL